VATFRTSDFLTCLVPLDAAGYLNLRVFKSFAENTFVRMSDPDAMERIAAWVRQHRKFQDLYMGVAERRRPDVETPGGKANCSFTRALHCEIDFQSEEKPRNLPEVEVRAILAAYKLPPSIIVHSGGGLHVYWLLDEPANLADADTLATVEGAVRELVRVLGGDPNAVDASRVLRIPGTFNHKQAALRPVVIEQCEPARRYTLAEFDQPVPVPESEREPRAPGSASAGLADRDRAVALLASTFPPLNTGVHYYVLKIAGWFAHSGIEIEDAYDILGAADGIACGGISTDRDTRAAIRDTYRKHAKGEEVAGLPSALVQVPALEPVLGELKTALGIVPVMAGGSGIAGEAVEAVEQGRPLFGFNLQFVHEIEPEPISWLWKGYIQRGELTLYAGDAGGGKTYLSEDLSVRRANGTTWPDGTPVGEPGKVLHIVVEDNLKTTTRPRLIAMGDTSQNILVISGKSDHKLVSLLDDLKEIENVCKHYRVDLVVISPINAYLGSVKGKTDNYSDPEIRAVLSPIVQMAQRLNIAVIGVMHLSKASQVQVLYKLAGSVAFGAVPRTIYYVSRDKNDRDLRYFSCPKMSNAKEPLTWTFRIAPTPTSGETAIVHWGETTPESAQDLMQAEAAKPGAKGSKTTEAAEFLKHFLRDGPRGHRDVLAAASELGLTLVNLNKAKARTLKGHVASRNVVDEKRRITGHVWELTEPSPPDATEVA
jgi:putative DNA primase/helicase